VIEKGISPPPRPDLAFSELQQARLPLFHGFFRDLEKWLRRLRDVTALIQTADLTIDVASVAANTTSEQTFTVVGLQVTDIVYVSKPTHHVGLGIVNCRVSATDTLAITFMNCTGGAINPGSETYLVASIRR
jgi:hypothetical protein